MANKKEKWVCTKCGGTNVQMKAWVNPNTDEIEMLEPKIEDCWCEDCQEHYLLELK